MKVLIVDNDEILRLGLRTLLKQIDGISAIDEAAGVEAGLRILEHIQPDVVLLDVEMDDGTGFDFLNRLSDYAFQVIFITSHNKYAVEAFRFSALDFVQKPIDPEDLKRALLRAKELLKSNDLLAQIKVLQSALLGIRNVDEKIVLRDNKSLYFIKVSDILNCEAQGSYTTFYIINGDKIVVSKSLREYEALLSPFGFIRTHNSHLVNPKKITRLDKSDGGFLILENGSSVPISQRKWDYILSVLDK
jgi:two-component system LytT family response regulator